MKIIKKIKRVLNADKIHLVIEAYAEETDRYWEIMDKFLDAIESRKWEDADVYSHELDKIQLILDLLVEKLDNLTM